jgi:hypothetical protein
MQPMGIKITDQCLALDKQMLQLKDAISHADWERAKDVLWLIELIAKGVKR